MPRFASELLNRGFGMGGRIIAFLFICVGVASLSLHFFPPHSNGTVWVSARNPLSIAWDTGYGFNEWQKSVFSEQLAGPPLIVDGREYFPAQTFIRLGLPSAVRIISRNGDLVLYYGSQNIFHRATCEMQREKNTVSCDFKLREWPSVPRKNWILFLFCCGVGLISLLLGGFLDFTLKYAWRASRGDPFSLVQFSLLLGCGGALDLIFTLGWPGFQNPFDPIDLLQVAGTSEGGVPQLNPAHSPLLQVFWASLHEAFPFYFLLNTAEASFFFLALLFFAETLWARGWRATRLFCLFFLLLLSPLAICYELFLERSIASAHVNCVLAIYAYLLITQKKQFLRRQIVIFSLLFTLSEALRTDNLPFALCLAIFFGFRLPLARRAMLGVMLVFSIFGNFILLPRVIHSPPKWGDRYLVESTIRSLTALTRQRPEILKKDNWVAVIDKAVRLDEVRKDLPFGSNHADRMSEDPSAVKAYLEVFRRITFEMPGSFLSFRWSFFRSLLSGTGIWFADTVPISVSHGRMLNMRILPLDSFIDPQASIGLSRSHWLPDAARDSFAPLLELGLLLALALAYWWRAGLLLVIACFARMIIVYLLAPEPNGFYLFDVYLISCFLLVAGGAQAGVILRKFFPRNDSSGGDDASLTR